MKSQYNENRIALKSNEIEFHCIIVLFLLNVSFNVTYSLNYIYLSIFLFLYYFFNFFNM
jgi:hypothetical protein